MVYASENKENKTKGEWDSVSFDVQEIANKISSLPRIDITKILEKICSQNPETQKLLEQEIRARENEIDKKSTQNVIKTVLTNVYAKADENLQCMVCYEHFPVSFRFSCGHELCASCADKIMYDGNKKCPKCRAQLPYDLPEWLNMIQINTIQLTPDITLEKLQHAFPLICSVGSLTEVTKCINLGVDVNTKGFYNYFPIHLASQKSVVIFLVDKGADVNQVTLNGATPLLISSENGHLQVVQYWIEHGADVNRGNNHGTTPLFMSSQNGHLPVVEYLIQHGADVNQGNNKGVTPLLFSSQEGYLPIVEYLIKHGADVNRGKNDGAIPLCQAIYKNQTEVAKFLLRKNADIEIAKFVFRKFGKLQFIEILEKLCKDMEEIN